MHNDRLINWRELIHTPYKSPLPVASPIVHLRIAEVTFTVRRSSLRRAVEIAKFIIREIETASPLPQTDARDSTAFFRDSLIRRREVKVRQNEKFPTTFTRLRSPVL